jgi:hypothetical protein
MWWMVQIFQLFFQLLIQVLPEKPSIMSDINTTCLLGLGFLPWWPAYVDDDVNLTRGDR